MFGELPYIFSISLAIYLSFEYWDFPDLTIEGSFVAGMALTAYAFDQKYLATAWCILLLFFLIIIIYSTVTYILSWLEMPSLLSGLMTLFIAFWINYSLNGDAIAKDVYTANSFKPFGNGHNTSERFYQFGLYFMLFLACILVMFDKTTLGKKIRLSRRTPNHLVTHTANLNGSRNLFIAMLVYNSIACFGGIAKALSDNYSGIEMFGLIAPGLACMFFVKLIKNLLSTPKRKPQKNFTYKIAPKTIVRWTDKLWFVILCLLVFSLALTYIRYLMVASRLATDTSIINAWTGVIIIILWMTLLGSKIVSKIRERL